MSKPKEGISAKISDGLQLADAFGIPNRLYHEGKEKFKTTVGGVITLITVLVVLLLCVPEIVSVLGYEQFVFNSY